MVAAGRDGPGLRTANRLAGGGGRRSLAACGRLGPVHCGCGGSPVTGRCVSRQNRAHSATRVVARGRGHLPYRRRGPVGRGLTGESIRLVARASAASGMGRYLDGRPGMVVDRVAGCEPRVVHACPAPLGGGGAGGARPRSVSGPNSGGAGAFRRRKPSRRASSRGPDDG